MGILKKEIEFAKEVDDVLVLLNTLVADIKAKKTAAEIAGDCLLKLKEAVDGVTGIKDELAANKEVVFETIGYRTGELTKTLIS